MTNSMSYNYNNGPSNKEKPLPKIHIHTSGETGIFANAYLVETQNGIVAIDSTLTVTESRSFKTRLDEPNMNLISRF